MFHEVSEKRVNPAKKTCSIKFPKIIVNLGQDTPDEHFSI
jgi:hypothetical protein